MDTNDPSQTSDSIGLPSDLAYAVGADAVGMDAVAAAVPVIPATAVRFCGGCGSPRDPAVVECPVCAKHRSAVTQASAEWTADRSFVRTAVWFYFSLLAISIITMAIIAGSGEPFSVSALFVEEGIMAAITLGFFIRARRDVIPVLLKLPGPQWLLLAILCAVPTYLVALLATEGMHRLIGLELIKYLPQFTNDGYGLGWAIFAIAVFPAIVEEIGFRGVILSSLQRVLSNREAILVSALMFAILHLSPLSIPHLFLLGAAAAYLRVKTGSLLPGMFLHFTHNLLCVLAEYHGSSIPW